mgnify:CR=1 FL=1
MKPIEKDINKTLNDNNMGRGYFGFPKVYNFWIRLFVIIFVFTSLAFYLFSIAQNWAAYIALAVCLMFSALNGLIDD